jgi:hypothetical protein
MYYTQLALLSFMDKLKQGLLYVDAAMEQVRMLTYADICCRMLSYAVVC